MQQAGSLSVLLEPDQFEWKSNFLIIDIREGNINDNSKLLILPINVLLINNLVAPAIFQIKEDKEQYCIGVEICFFSQTSCHQIWLGGADCQNLPQIWRRIDFEVGPNWGSKMQINEEVITTNQQAIFREDPSWLSDFQSA